MQSNKLRVAIRATAAAAIFGVAGQASAIELSAGDFKADLYGFARLAASYDLDGNLASNSGGRAGKFNEIAVGNESDTGGHFGADANTSRLGVAVTSPEGVLVRVEMDFDRDGSITPRLRRAYGEYKGVLLGQEWSNFNSFVGNPSILDWDSLPGRAGLQGRIAQARYTSGPLSFSVEDDTNRDSSAGYIDGVTSDKTAMPVFTARLEDSSGAFSYSAAGLVKQLSYDDGTDDDSQIGFATFLSGRIAVTDMLTIMGSVSYADGAANYIYRSGSNFAGVEAYTDANGDIETIEAYGANIGAGLNLGNGRSINIGYGTTMKDLDDGVDAGVVAATTTESNSMLAINYQWKPVNRVNMGVELQRLSTEQQNGDDGDANRILFVGQYNF